MKEFSIELKTILSLRVLQHNLMECIKKSNQLKRTVVLLLTKRRFIEKLKPVKEVTTFLHKKTDG
jgi:hypothetical protein